VTPLVSLFFLFSQTIRRTNDNWNSIPPIADFGGNDSGDEDGYDQGGDDHYDYNTDDYGPPSANDHGGEDGHSKHTDDINNQDNYVPPMALDEPEQEHVETYEDLCRHQIVPSFTLPPIAYCQN